MSSIGGNKFSDSDAWLFSLRDDNDTHELDVAIIVIKKLLFMNINIVKV